jgi:hypothetical protein
MNLDRTLVISANVFREIIRDRVLYIIGFFTVALIAVATLIPDVAAGNENKIIIDVGTGDHRLCRHGIDQQRNR